jgi:hypothetical protein
LAIFSQAHLVTLLVPMYLKKVFVYNGAVKACEEDNHLNRSKQ